MIKGLIFDMDGVLIDSEPLYRILNDKLFKALGFSLTDEAYAQYVGTTDEKMLRDLKARFSLKQSVAEMNRMREAIHLTFFKKTDLSPMKSVQELLNWAKERELKLAVASSTDEKIVHLILEKLGILGVFQAVVCGNQIEQSKPAPDIFLKAAEKLELKPEACVVIEDSTNGVQAGRRAGMTVIGFQSDDGSQDLSESHIRVDSLEEAKNAIEERL